MSTVRDLLQHLEAHAPFRYQADYDNARLITGRPDQEITGVLCTLDSIEDTVYEAVDRGCNVIVAHHPIVFSGLKSLTGATYIERTIIEAIRHHIAIIAVHTNLDSVHPGGVNSALAEMLGLGDGEVLRPNASVDDSQREVGAGLIGTLGEEMDHKDFLGYVKTRLQLPVIKHTAPISRKIHRVAICGGSGSFLLEDALRHGADAFITSDYKYHQFFDADGRIVILDIGHYESERHVITLLQRLIHDKFDNFAAHCTNLDTNPIDYYL